MQKAPGRMWLRAGIVLLNASGFGLTFYGLAIFGAALVTHFRYLRSNGGPIFPIQFESLAAAQDVARQGLFYGLLIIVGGLILLAVGRLLRRIQNRKRALEPRRGVIR
jgi:hypothetical protein